MIRGEKLQLFYTVTKLYKLKKKFFKTIPSYIFITRSTSFRNRKTKFLLILFITFLCSFYILFTNKTTQTRFKKCCFLRQNQVDNITIGVMTSQCTSKHTAFQSKCFLFQKTMSMKNFKRNFLRVPKVFIISTLRVNSLCILLVG